MLFIEIIDSTEISLFEILKEVHSGKIQITDFWRGWTWDDIRIKGRVIFNDIVSRNGRDA
jgi:hypothetical protein